MKTLFTVVTALALTAVVPTLGDLGTVRASQGHHLFLAEASTPSPGSHDTAMAENESNGASPGGHDRAFAETESNGASPGAHDRAFAETESNGPSPGGRDTAQV